MDPPDISDLTGPTREKEVRREVHRRVSHDQRGSEEMWNCRPKVLPLKVLLFGVTSSWMGGSETNTVRTVTEWPVSFSTPTRVSVTPSPDESHINGHLHVWPVVVTSSQGTPGTFTSTAIDESFHHVPNYLVQTFHFLVMTLPVYRNCIK